MTTVGNRGSVGGLAQVRQTSPRQWANLPGPTSKHPEFSRYTEVVDMVRACEVFPALRIADEKSWAVAWVSLRNVSPRQVEERLLVC